MTGSGEPAVRPVWARPTEAVALVLRGRTARVAVPVAAVVGTVISVVNQGDVLIGSGAELRRTVNHTLTALEVRRAVTSP